MNSIAVHKRLRTSAVTDEAKKRDMAVSHHLQGYAGLQIVFQAFVRQNR
jgi:hypothetical protein